MTKTEAESIRDALVRMIRSFLAGAGCSRAVLGVSGGKDSSVAAALCARAVGPENVLGVMLPDGVQSDLEDSREVCRALGIRAVTVNIGKVHAALREAALPALTEEERFSGRERESDINVPPRLRMTVLRYLAQATGSLLCGTGNLSERTVGYCTKDGDASCDFNPLGALTSKEVVTIGLALPELPERLVRKAPSDGLSGKPDEERLGVSYAAIHAYLRTGSSGDEQADRVIRQKERASAHKRRLPPIADPFTEKWI
ncbi:MAG: NAD(+) synthase [Clostridia bacterium]|nr:NAD(+) synthase [Clostridia bacterium]